MELHAQGLKTALSAQKDNYKKDYEDIYTAEKDLEEVTYVKSTTTKHETEIHHFAVDDRN